MKTIVMIIAMLLLFQAPLYSAELKATWTYDEPGITGFIIYDSLNTEVINIPDPLARTVTFSYVVDKTVSFYMKAYRIDNEATVFSDVSQIISISPKTKPVKATGTFIIELIPE